MSEGIFDAMYCRQCGGRTSTDAGVEYYELRYTNIPNSGERMDIGNGRTMPKPNVDLAATDKLSGVFCSARCLTAYVQAHVAPDAAGE